MVRNFVLVLENLCFVSRRNLNIETEKSEQIVFDKISLVSVLNTFNLVNHKEF